MAFKRFVLIACLASVFGARVEGRRGKDLGRVFNGAAAGETQFPYQARLYTEIRGGSFSACGASIISADWVLSAAHCFTGFARGDTSVYMGFWRESDGPLWVDDVPSSNVIIHPGWDTKTFQNDVALIRLTEPIPFEEFPDEVSTVNLPDVEADGTVQGADPNYYNNKRAVVSGWGRTNNAVSSAPSTLQYTYVNVMPHDACQRYFENRDITDGQLCSDKTLPPFGGPCQGDSGGPLALNVTSAAGVDTYQIGIASFISAPKLPSGETACINKNPAVYANVAYYLPWIYANTGLNGTMG